MHETLTKSAQSHCSRFGKEISQERDLARSIRRRRPGIGREGQIRHCRERGHRTGQMPMRCFGRCRTRNPDSTSRSAAPRPGATARAAAQQRRGRSVLIDAPPMKEKLPTHLCPSARVHGARRVIGRARPAQLKPESPWFGLLARRVARGARAGRGGALKAIISRPESCSREAQKGRSR